MAMENSDLILKEVKAIHSILKDHEERLKPLERWKIAYDAADAAIAKYKQENLDMGLSIANKPSVFSDGVNKDFVKIILQFTGIVGGLIGLISLILKYFIGG